MTNNIKQFSNLEVDLLTKCWDSRDAYGINIDWKNKAVSIIAVKEKRIIKHLGNANTLVEKFIRDSGLIPTYYEF
jgi:hypothetical protein